MLIEWKKPSVYGIGPNVLLQPGVNDIADKDWKAVAEHEIVKQQIKDGELVVKAGGEAKGKEPGEPAKFEDMDPDTQHDLVANTFDRDLLGKWLKSAKGDVKDAITDQLDNVDPKKKK